MLNKTVELFLLQAIEQVASEQQYKPASESDLANWMTQNWARIGQALLATQVAFWNKATQPTAITSARLRVWAAIRQQALIDEIESQLNSLDPLPEPVIAPNAIALQQDIFGGVTPVYPKKRKPTQLGLLV